MQFHPSEIPDVLLLEPRVFGDDRGFFFESYNQRVFTEKAGNSVQFVQDNHTSACSDSTRKP